MEKIVQEKSTAKTNRFIFFYKYSPPFRIYIASFVLLLLGGVAAFWLTRWYYLYQRENHTQTINPKFIIRNSMFDIQKILRAELVSFVLLLLGGVAAFWLTRWYNDYLYTTLSFED